MTRNSEKTTFVARDWSLISDGGWPPGGVAPVIGGTHDIGRPIVWKHAGDI